MGAAHWEQTLAWEFSGLLASQQPRAPLHGAAVPKRQPELLEREEGRSCAGERVHRCSALYCTPTPAHRGGSNKFFLALEEEGETGREQVRSGTSQPSSGSAESFAGGSYGHRELVQP